MTVTDLTRWLFPRPRASRPARRPRLRLALEPLEDRCVPAAYNTGDVFVGGQAGIHHYDANGNFLGNISTTPTTGMTFDHAGNFYATEFFNSDVRKFDPNLNPVGFFGSGYTASTESILFDTAGNAYVGQAQDPFSNPVGTIFKFDAAGNPLTTYSVATENRGTDWIQLAPDQHTVYYTSEGNRILRYDTTTRTQLPDFVSNLPGSAAYALRFLPGACGSTGQLLVADSEQIHLLDATGRIIRSYDAPGEDTWFAININPDGRTFWSGGIDTGTADEFDIATGALLKTITTGDFIGGIAVAGEIVNPVPPPHVQEQVTYYATAAGPGGAPEVKVYNAQTNQQVFDFLAYDPNFLGGVRVATGDVNGDGFPDIITVPGPGGGPNVRVFSGKDGSLIRNFLAYDRRLTTGLFVGAGDTNGDTKADIIVAPDRGAGPNVRVYDGASNALLYNFMAYNARFSGGVRVTGGDVNDDGFSDITVGAGPGGGPNVEVFDGRLGLPIASFMAYDPRFTGGVFVATGQFGDLADTDCPPKDIITGAGAGGGGNVRVFDGTTGAMLRNFLAPPQGFIFGPDGLPGPDIGTHVATLDHNGSRLDGILVSYGEGANALVNLFDFNTQTRIDSFFAYNPLFQGGIFIGSGH